MNTQTVTNTELEIQRTNSYGSKYNTVTVSHVHLLIDATLHKLCSSQFFADFPVFS